MDEVSRQSGVEDPAPRLAELLERQRRAQAAEGPPEAGQRAERLARLVSLLRGRRGQIVAAAADDFGHRSPEQTLLADVAGTIGSLEFARRRVRRWMRPERRRAGFPFGLLGARASVHHQPKGVVGIVGPWNFPFNLALAPLAGVLAAGNRAIVKPSEHAPACAELMARMIGDHFDEAELAVVTGGPELAAAFTRLPFDHLVFTGSTEVGRHVMRAAADHLVPLTLELGGKSPVIVSRSADLAEAVPQIITGKLMNAGQVCLAPDYVLVPAEQVEEFVGLAREAVAACHPTMLDNPDCTSVVDDRHFRRLRGLLDDAVGHGARAIECNPAGEDFNRQPHRKLPPTLILGADDRMAVMREEIFGPLLPVLGYRSIDEAIDRVNRGARPLALYYFGTDPAEEARVLGRTSSGGVTINDVIMHVAIEDLPFGGSGPSGMGRYHGIDGFREFSNARAVYRQSPLRLVAAMFRPPYGPRARRQIERMIGGGGMRTRTPPDA